MSLEGQLSGTSKSYGAFCGHNPRKVISNMLLEDRKVVHETNVEFDELGRLTKHHSPDSDGETRLEYGENGFLKCVHYFEDASEDPVAIQTFSYDELSRLNSIKIRHTQEQDIPDNELLNLYYLSENLFPVRIEEHGKNDLIDCRRDSDGRFVALVSKPAGERHSAVQTTEFQYDGKNRLIAEVLSEQNNRVSEHLIFYDIKGRVKRIQRPHFVRKIEYDQSGRIVKVSDEEEYPVNGEWDSYWRTTHQFDLAY